MTKSLTYVEIDVPYCSLTYGVAPCSAVLGKSGADRCYNTVATCQSAADYAASTVTLRFAIDASYLPSDILSIPSVKDVQYDPATISLGEDLGLRGTLTIRFKDHPDSDALPGLDRYAGQRSYDPFKQGTFWGRFRARQPYVWGMPVRLIRGDTSQALAEMETRHFLGDSFDGPTPDGTYTLVAKDVLRFATGDVSQAPIVSQGYLSADLTSGGTFATLLPTGIGDAEYAASGYVCIGGNEICSFTRSGDGLTLTRGQLGTTASAHNQEDAAQVVLYYLSQDPANIIADLLTTYAAVPANYVPLTDWLSETGTYLNQVYTGVVSKPTSVATLINEIIQQAALALWWDDLNQVIKLQVLRGIPTDTSTFDEDSIVAGSFQVAEQQDKRLTESWVNYGQRDPTLELTQLANFRSVAATVDETTESNLGTPMIEAIFSRWIAQFGRTIAQQLGSVRVARYKNPPRKFNFDLFRGASNAFLGGGYKLKFWNLQGADGNRVEVPVQVTRLEPAADRLKIEAWEVTSSATTGAAGSGDHTITIDVTSSNLNLRTIHDALYTPAVSGTNVICTINSGVIVGSTNTFTPAFDIGDWADGVNVSLIVNGRIQGAGGNAGKGAAKTPPPNATDGSDGGTGLYTRFAISLTSLAGAIWSGGGGGGGGGGSTTGAGGGGGGGAGYPTSGSGGGGGGGGGHVGHSGTATAGGSGGASGGGTGGAGGDGGGPGQNGSTGAGTSGTRGIGGARGSAIDGISLITLADAGGDIRGPEIN